VRLCFGRAGDYRQLVPEVVDADALAFAAVRAAHLEPPRQVADGLLAAADWPDACLKGVTAYEARMRAAEVLNSAGDRAGALKVLGDETLVLRFRCAASRSSA
jgi:hypothetical protein